MKVRWAIPAWRSALGTWTEREATLVVVEEDGARGIGEAAPLPGGSMERAMEWAMWCARTDARARARGVSVAALVSGGRPAARLPIAAVVEDAAAARVAVARGVRTLKVKVGGGLAIERVREIRAAVGASVGIRVDANGTDVGDVGDAEYVEEPAVRVRRFALDESLVTADPAGVAAVVKPTVLGAARAFEVAERARAAGIPVVVSHALEGVVGYAMCVELALAWGGPLAHGLDLHGAARAWGIDVPTFDGCAIVDAPRVGCGLDVEAVLERARCVS